MIDVWLIYGGSVEGKIVGLVREREDARVDAIGSS
jgi:stage V sporulation protein SpoVS